MKRFFVIAAAAAACVIAFGGCAKQTVKVGNKVVSNAQSYLQSEAGFDGDVSKALSKVDSYLQQEIGLNNSSNQVLEGTWEEPKDYIDDWTWTFDGKNGCTLSSVQYNSSTDGTYSVNESEGTVDILLNTWDQPQKFTYKLRQTLSDTMLTLSADDQGYSLTKKK